MECNQVKKQLTAWADQELSAQDQAEIDRHLDACPDCRKEAAALERLNQALDSLGKASAPSGFSLRVCRAAIRQQIEVPDLAQWWQHLTFAWRGLVCGTALAGLVCGVMLATNLSTSLDDGAKTTPYLAMYDDGGFYQ